MTRRTEFTASIQSEVRFGKTRKLPKERNAATERVGTGLRLGVSDQALKTKILRPEEQQNGNELPATLSRGSSFYSR